MSISCTATVRFPCLIGRVRTRGVRLLVGALLLAGLAGCAGSVAPPTVVSALPAAERATLHLGGVTTEAAQGVTLSAADTSRITQLVTSDLRTAAPGLLDPASPQPKALRIVVTRYDSGNAGARFMLAGLGQIRIEGDVTVTDPATGRVMAEYKVAKQFSFGGIYGALTSAEDVEKGFSKSVAALFKP